MKDFIEGIVAPIDRDNIDTDQIIPTEYLKSIKKFGYEDYLFDGWRYKDQGRLGMKKVKEKSIMNLFLTIRLMMNLKFCLQEIILDAAQVESMQFGLSETLVLKLF